MRTVDRHEITHELNKELPCMTHESEYGDGHSLMSIVSHPNPTTASLLKSKPIVHRKEAGINPLVDAASYIFSLMGKLKHLKYCNDFKLLQNELVAEIENFKETVETCLGSSEYLAEYLPISLYALCMTIDDIISSTAWGDQGAWDEYSLISHFNESPLSGENFLIILERLILDPDIYIDVIEFFYICLNLGFRCKRSAEFSYEQLERIANSLYKRIRNYHGNYNKTLTPFPLRVNKSVKSKLPKPIYIIGGMLIFSGLFAAFAIGSYLTYSGLKKNLSNVQVELIQ